MLWNYSAASSDGIEAALIFSNSWANASNSGGTCPPSDCIFSISAVIATKASFKAVGTIVTATVASRLTAEINVSIAAAAEGLKLEIATDVWLEIVVAENDWTTFSIITWVTVGESVIVTWPDPRLDLIVSIVSELTPALDNASDNVVGVAEA